MVYIYLPLFYYHLNLDVTKKSLLAGGFSAVFLVKPRPCFARRGFLLCVCLSVCVFVFVSVSKISQKILNRSTSFLAGLPSDPGRKPFDFEKYHPGVRVGVGGSKFGPNDKR